MKKGIFCISIDTELLWGRHDLEFKLFIERAQKEREIIVSLLTLFAKYSVPVTWAIVGHLFLKMCSKKNSIKHSDIVRPKYPWVKKDWFDSDPASNIKKNPEWYGYDIIEKIKKVSYQEIACHSFSHVIFGHPGCSRECAESEMKMCKLLEKKHNMRFFSFTFPRNSIGHIDVLKKYGFGAYRDKEHHWYSFVPNKTLNKLISAIDLFLPVSPPLGNPYKINGIFAIPSSMYFVSSRGLRKYIPHMTRYKKVKRGIDKAIKTKKIFHLWTHPTDLIDNRHMLFEELEEIIKYACKMREEKKLEIKSMKNIIKSL